MGHVQTSRLIPAPVERVFAYLSDLKCVPATLDEDLQLRFPDGFPKHVRPRDEITVEWIRFGIGARATLHVDLIEPRERLSYHQVRGWLRGWSHTIVLASHDPQTTLVNDFVDFQLPLGLFGALLDDLFVHREIERVLNRRLERIEAHFLGHLEGRA